MIELKKITKYYNENAVVVAALKNVSLVIDGGFTAITGESGSGKTTLLNIIAGTDRYNEGELLYGGNETSYYDDAEWERYRREKVSYVYQDFNLLDSFSCRKNIEAALALTDCKNPKARALELLDAVGLSSHAKHKAARLSGGQKQRLAIARALAKDTPVILADEPTGNLDSKTSLEILSLLKEISRTKTLIMVTHNYNDAQAFIDRKIRLHNGEVIEDFVLNREMQNAECGMQNEGECHCEKHSDEAISTAEKFPSKIEGCHEVTGNVIEIAAPPAAPRNDKLVSRPRSVPFARLISLSGARVLTQPRKSTFLFSAFTLVTAIMLLAYTSMLNIDFGWSGSWAAGFVNFDRNRLVVKHADNSAFTAKDYEEISKISGVDVLVKQDMVLDDNSFNTNWTNPLLMPHSLLKAKSADWGRLPKTGKEALFSYGFADDDTANYVVNMIITFMGESLTVVGLVKDSAFRDRPRLFVAEEVLEKHALNSKFRQYFSLALGGSNSYVEWGQDEKLALGEIRLLIPEYHYNPVDVSSGDKVRYFYDDGYVQKTAEITISEVENTNKYYYFTLCASLATIKTLVGEEYYQCSVFVRNPGNIGSVAFSLKGKGYETVYPYDLQQSDILSMEFLSALVSNAVMILTAGMLLILLVLITGAVLKNKQRDYAVLRSLGYTRGELRALIFFEMMLVISAAVVAAVILFLVIINLPVELIAQMAAHFRPWYVLPVMLADLIVGALLSLIFSRRISRATVTEGLKRGA